MNTLQKIILTLCVCAVLFSLLYLPMENSHTTLTYPHTLIHSFGYWPLWSIGSGDKVRWDIVGLWWMAIALVGAGSMMMAKK